MTHDLGEIKKAMETNLLYLEETLKSCEYRIDRIDEKIKEQQKFRAEEVVMLNEIRDMIGKLK